MEAAHAQHKSFDDLTLEELRLVSQDARVEYELAAGQVLYETGKTCQPWDKISKPDQLRWIEAVYESRHEP